MTARAVLAHGFTQTARSWVDIERRLGGFLPDVETLAVCDVDCVWAFEKQVSADGANVERARQLLDDRVSLGWSDLDKAMNTDAFCDYKNIHEFDPPPEHLGGAGKAKYMSKDGDES